jgi:hypothetical protein
VKVLRLYDDERIGTDTVTCTTRFVDVSSNGNYVDVLLILTGPDMNTNAASGRRVA